MNVATDGLSASSVMQSERIATTSARVSGVFEAESLPVDREIGRVVPWHEAADVELTQRMSEKRHSENRQGVMNRRVRYHSYWIFAPRTSSKEGGPDVLIDPNTPFSVTRIALMLAS